MKFSLIAALCAAPLALAGTLNADIEVMKRYEAAPKRRSLGQRADTSVTTIMATQSTEIIIIWSNSGGTAATTTINAATSTGDAALATHTVTVGGSAGLVYTPSSISANVGDIVVFQFQSQNHTVTQSAFTSPCVATLNGINSGFMPNPNNSVNPLPMMAMQVTVSTPIWFYCAQKGHCGKGMTFSINPTANKTQALFEQMAIAQNGTAADAAASSSASVAVATTVATVAATATATATAAAATSTGTGTVDANGACSCSCLCGAENFPSNAQGLLSFGGISGSLAMAALT